MKKFITFFIVVLACWAWAFSACADEFVWKQSYPMPGAGFPFSAIVSCSWSQPGDNPPLSACFMNGASMEIRRKEVTKTYQNVDFLGNYYNCFFSIPADFSLQVVNGCKICKLTVVIYSHEKHKVTYSKEVGYRGYIGVQNTPDGGK